MLNTSKTCLLVMLHHKPHVPQMNFHLANAKSLGFVVITMNVGRETSQLLAPLKYCSMLCTPFPQLNKYPIMSVKFQGPFISFEF